MAYALGKLYPGKIDIDSCRKLIGSKDVIKLLKSGEDPRVIEQRIEEELSTFDKRRSLYLLY